MSEWNALSALLDSAPGEWSACVWDARGNQRFGHHQHVARSSASLIKVPIALALYDALPHLLDERVALREEDRVEGEGAFDRAPTGTVRSLRELVAHALRESDNTAANLLIDRIGFERVNAWIEWHGLATRLRRKFMDFAALASGRDNTTTAADMCALFHRLLLPRYAEPLAMLREAGSDGKLEAGLPPGTPIAHKVGDLPGVEHDAGIVFAPREHYTIAVMGVALPDATAGRATIARVSRIVWREMASEGLEARG